jgi:hypothetical protein
MAEFKDEAERDAYVLRLHFRLKWTPRAVAQALNLSLATVLQIISAHEAKVSA